MGLHEMTNYPVEAKTNSRENHEATEVAKVAIELSRLDGKNDPTSNLDKAMDLITEARARVRKYKQKD